MRERRTPRKANFHVQPTVFSIDGLRPFDVPDSIPEVFLLKMRSIYITEPPNKGKVREKKQCACLFLNQ